MQVSQVFYDPNGMMNNNQSIQEYLNYDNTQYPQGIPATTPNAQGGQYVMYTNDPIDNGEKYDHLLNEIKSNINKNTGAPVVRPVEKQSESQIDIDILELNDEFINQ